MDNMARNADDMARNLKDINNMSTAIKLQSIDTKKMITDGNWDQTMKDLVSMLEGSSRDSARIRQDLESISVDLNKLKS